MKDKLIILLATFFGAGFLPLIEGTWASIAALIIYLVFLKANILLHLLLLAIVTLVGFLVCTGAERIFKKKDADKIVIDEVAGMLLSLLFIPAQPYYLACAFFLFRLYDTIKPAPTHSVERLSGSLGVMGDDLVAGIYSNITLQALRLVLRLFNL
jgi:phosphatidylglycerophosphatase A